MVSPVLTERRHSGGFLVSEARGERSRDQVTILQQSSNFQSSSSPILPAGLVLGETLVGLTATAAAKTQPNANTGTGTCSAVTVQQGAKQGVYALIYFSATEYELNDPSGALVGEGINGSVFQAGAGPLSFTMTAGGTAFVAGDAFNITLAANANVGLYAPLNLLATDGTQNAAAILFNETDASQGNTNVTVIDIDAEVNGSELVYPAGVTTAQIAAINAQLTALDIKVR